MTATRWFQFLLLGFLVSILPGFFQPYGPPVWFFCLVGFVVLVTKSKQLRERILKWLDGY